MTHARRPGRNASRIFAWPLAILLASIAGLVLGLLGTGWRDGLSWLLLAGGPLAVALHLITRTHTKESR